MEGEYFSSSTAMQSTTQRKKNSKNSNRRFSDEQIKALESVFETETKLEPRKKMQIARKLGLQPRQVAIWFQNKRARWKSKQIEQEYRVLKANYDDLNSQFASLQIEKHSLLIQLQKLNELLKLHHGGGKDTRGNYAAGGPNNGNETCEFEAKRDCSNEGLEKGLAMYSDDDERGNTCRPVQEKEQEIFTISKEEDGSLVPVKKQSGLGYSDIFDQSCDTSNWWEFWN